MQHVVFGQKLKKSFLIAVLSFVLVLPIVGSIGFPEPVFAEETPAPAPAAPPPPATEDKDIIDEALDALKSGFEGMVNLFLIMFIQIVMKFMELLAWLFSFSIGFLQTIIKYNEYGTQEEVSVAWAIVRDAINSFFIVVLIVIAISTIIRFQPYNFRSTLPRLILATLLVNFSKTICLLAISFANSIMMTFSDALIEILPVYALGLRLPALTALDSASIGGVGGGTDVIDALAKKPIEILNILVATVLGAFMLLFALGGFVMFVIILLFRIIVLWFLIILSPLAFFLWGVPGRGSSYWGQWLEEFVKHLIVGPIGAFLLYIIALFYVGNIQNSYGFTFGGKLPEGAITVATSPSIMIGYLVSLGMMFIALEIVEKLGVRGGQFARDIGVEKISKGGLRALRGAVTGGAGIAADYATKWTGIPLSPTRAFEGIKGALSEKREQLAQDAVRKTAKVGADLAEKGSRFSFAYALASGNKDVLAATNISDAFRYAKSFVPGTAASKYNDNLKTEYNKNKAHMDAVSKYNSLGANEKALIGNMTGKDLSKQLALSTAFKEYQQNKAMQGSLPQLEADWRTALGAGDAADQQKAFDALQSAKQADLKAQNFESQNSELLASAEQTESIKKIGEKQEDLQKLSDSLEKAGVQTDTMESFGKATGRHKNVEDSQKKVVGEMKRRQKFGSLAAAGARSDLTAKMKDYTTQTYEREVKYGADDIYGNMLLNRDPKKRESFAADLVKAAEMGKFDDVLHKFQDKQGQPYQASPEGVKKFIEEVLQGELGFNQQESFTIVAEAQGRNLGAKKVSQMYVKMDAGTKEFEFMGHGGPDGGAQAKAVESKLKDMSAHEALRTLKLDGLGSKDSSGNFVANKGAIRALKASGLKALIQNSNKFNDVDADTKREFLIKNAAELGLDQNDINDIEKSLK